MEDPYQDRSLPEEPLVAHTNGSIGSGGVQDEFNPRNLTQKDYYAILNVHNTVCLTNTSSALGRQARKSR
jgi:hypothetical protein